MFTTDIPNRYLAIPHRSSGCIMPSYGKTFAS
jgi:hypothetical protein